MSKRPPKQGFQPNFAPGTGRPTVPLPGAAGGYRPTVALPGSAAVSPRPPSKAELLEAMKVAAGHFGAGRFEHARLIVEKILGIAPGMPDALHLRGLIALETGNFVEAEQLIAAAVKAAGRAPANMLVNLGNARRQQAKYDAALDAYARALKADPKYVDAYVARGILWTLADDHDRAFADFNRAMTLRPDAPAPYIRATEAAMRLGLFREALAICAKALEKDPSLPAVFFALMANIHERLSELDEALAYAEKALAEPLGDAYSEAARIWARATRRQNPGDAQALAEARKLLEAVDFKTLPFDQARTVYEELAQICDKQGDVDMAFTYFSRMNERAGEEARARGIDKGAYLARVEALIEATTPDRIAGWSALPAPRPESERRAPPVFLVGFPRSGTTLLDQILDAHPDVQVLEEKPVLREIGEAADGLPGGYPASLAPLTDAARDELRRLYRSTLIGQGGDIANKVVIDKLPLNIIHAALIHRVLPEAKIILALRHPADAVLSCFMQDFQLNTSMANFLTLEDAAHLYDRVMTLWQATRALLPLNVVEVRYENLVGDLRAEVEPVIDFLGLSWAEAQADPAAHAKARGTIRTPSYTQVTQPIYASSTDRWRRYEKHLAPVLPILEKHIRHFGYSL
jgi:tetratricopeptide (TPR) repeat protein